MRQLFARSFQSRLLAAFLALSLIPMLICSAFLAQVFRLRVTEHADAGAVEQLQSAITALHGLHGGLVRAADALGQSAVLANALTRASAEDTEVYRVLFAAVEDVRAMARFDLYDMDGVWRYSTQQAPLQARLPTDWGVLSAAARAGGALVYMEAEEQDDTQSPLLQAGALLLGPDGRQAGYLLVSMTRSHLRQLLDGSAGAQSDLILLSAYWRPIYCAQPALAAALAPDLRTAFLEGGALDAVGEDFFYRAAHHGATGLYLVLQSPNLFNRAILGVLYTVTLTCVLICLAASVFVSIHISRRMFRPIRLLQRAIGEVEQDNLDTRVTPPGQDELSRLAERFNEMLAALKRNRELLVDNERALNQAQIRMLQAQLNPHFLCNTLDTMKWMGKINQVPQVALIATNLADIVRMCISPEEFVPLSREFALVERYVEIQNIRMSGAVDLELDLPASLADCPVPKMMLQPLVENAILHGLDGVVRGTVRVEAREEGGLLTLQVADSGRGLPAELCGPYARRSPELAQGRLGLYNVDTILVKHYGQGYGLYLDNNAHGGAVVRAQLPILRRAPRGEEETSC